MIEIPLGKYTNYVSGRGQIYALQRGAKSLLPGERVNKCCNCAVPGSRIKVNLSISDVAYYKGLIKCGSVWMCPVCASRISEGRRVEIYNVVKAWTGSLLFVTFTHSHTKNDRLSELRDRFSRAYKKLHSGRAWGDITRTYGIKGFVTSTEVTYGVNGWHLHKHCLFFCDHEVVTTNLKAKLFELYKYKLNGESLDCDYEHGLDVRQGDKAIGDYLSKSSMSFEIAKSVNKKGGQGSRSAFELLSSYCEGDKQAGFLFVEYAQAMKGVRHISWSRGFVRSLGINELKDEELNKDVEGELNIVFISNRAWSMIMRFELRNYVLRLAEKHDFEELDHTLLKLESESRKAYDYG